MVTFEGMTQLRAGKAAFERVVRQWIKYVQERKVAGNQGAREAG